jgi:hypothetical protein
MKCGWDTRVSEANTVSIFKVYIKEAISSSQTSVISYELTQWHNVEDQTKIK